MARTQITTDDYGYVTISYDHYYTGDRVTRTFFCPPDGGYVRESCDGYPQVCERLASMGNTLLAGSRETLPKLIRREYQAMRAAEKREAQRYAY
jgi:hypothetical protein